MTRIGGVNLHRGPLQALPRYGPASAAADDAPAEVVARLAAVPCSQFRAAAEAVGGTGTSMADVLGALGFTPAELEAAPSLLLRAVFRDKLAECFGIGDTIASAGGLAEWVAAVVGNGVLAAAGGGLLWLGVRRMFTLEGGA